MKNELSQKSIIEALKAEKGFLNREFEVLNIGLFGSYARGEHTLDSDIDFLISFTEKLTIEQYTDNYFTLQYKLRELFNRDIDIVTESTLSNPYFIESIDETKQLIYEA